MSSLRQIEANRRNAQKSTGPTSVTGKAASSMNALKTGIHAKSLVLPSENLADLEQLIDDYYQTTIPTTPEARSLVDDLIYGEWLKRRLRAAETQIWAYDHQENYRPTPSTLSDRPPPTAANLLPTPVAHRVHPPRLPPAPFRTSNNSRRKPSSPRTAATRPLNDSTQTTSPQIGFVPPTSQPHPSIRRPPHAAVPHQPQPTRGLDSSRYNRWWMVFCSPCQRVVEASNPSQLIGNPCRRFSPAWRYPTPT